MSLYDLDFIVTWCFNRFFACVSQVQEVREVMEAEMRTQLRRQAAAHTDHLRDVLKVQEQELREEAQEVRVFHARKCSVTCMITSLVIVKAGLSEFKSF